MKLFDVYPLYPITPVKGADVHIWDDKGSKYLDLYGGHAVISIGHSHPEYVKAINEQVQNLGFYSNAIQNPLQQSLAEKLGKVSGLEDYQLFLCNSGAEAVENALKLASFHTDRKKVLAFHKAFHGRTSAAVSTTDNPKLQAPFSSGHEVEFIALNDFEAMENALASQEFCALIIEGIQGVGGLDEGSSDFFQKAKLLCDKYGSLLIVDEIQSGMGRSGKFFAFQHHNIQPDLVVMAKGMANGFPIGAVLISPEIEASYGLLGSTFGGNHLACAAALTVLDVIEKQNLLSHSSKMEEAAHRIFSEIPGLKKIKGRGLMLGLQFDYKVAELRKRLILEKHIFTGGASDPNLLRILPPLTVQEKHFVQLADAIKQIITEK